MIDENNVQIAGGEEALERSRDVLIQTEVGLKAIREDLSYLQHAMAETEASVCRLQKYSVLLIRDLNREVRHLFGNVRLRN